MFHRTKTTKETPRPSPLSHVSVAPQSPQSLVQRVLYLQKTIGNRAVSTMFQQGHSSSDTLFQRMMKQPVPKKSEDNDEDKDRSNNINNSTSSSKAEVKQTTREIEDLRERMVCLDDEADEEDFQAELRLLYRILQRTNPAIVITALEEDPETEVKSKKKKGETPAQKSLRAFLKRAVASVDFNQYDIQDLPTPVVETANALILIIQELDEAHKGGEKKEGKLDQCLIKFSEFLVNHQGLLDKITITGQPLCAFLMGETDNGRMCNNQFAGKVIPLIQQAISGKPLVLTILELLEKAGCKPLVRL